MEGRQENSTILVGQRGTAGLTSTRKAESTAARSIACGHEVLVELLQAAMNPQ